VPTPPPAELLEPHDTTPYEVESRAELDRHLRAGSLAGLTVQGLPFDVPPVPDLSGIDLADTLFLGCTFPSAQVEADLVRRGAHVVPPLRGLPYPSHPSRLYTPADLTAGFAEHGPEGMYDNLVYRHFRQHGGALPEIREALAQRLHDHGIDNALADTTRAWVDAYGAASVIGVMGGHAVLRGSAAYRLAATLGWELTRAGRLVVTGGGPGVMEAANLGAYLSGHDADELAAAIDLLATAPDYADQRPYTGAALAVRDRYPLDSAVAADRLGWARAGGLAIPTWLYGHEPANLFAGRIAKYFCNAVREDTILRLCRGGIVFAPGRAGTVQEVFQAATKTFYGTDGASGPYVFLDRAFWTETLPVETVLAPLLAMSPAGDLSPLIRLTDDVHEAVSLLTQALDGTGGVRPPVVPAQSRS
jgi:predicted Rossmann-fold nucleotide-binding protein